MWHPRHPIGKVRARWFRFQLVLALTLAAARPVLSAEAVRADQPPLSPSTKLYVAHWARLTTQIPADWRPAPGPYNYQAGADGFIAAGPLPSRTATLEQACAQSVVVGTFGSAPTTRVRRLGAHEACQIDPSGDHPDAFAGQHAVVVRHPYPFEAFGERVEHDFILADGVHLPSLAARLDFDLAGVTSVAYIESAIDLVANISFFGDRLDWHAVRATARARARGLGSIAETYPILASVFAELRTAGDNHSKFFEPAVAKYVEQSAVDLGVSTWDDRVMIVYPGGPADRARIGVGDWIQSVDGRADSRFDPGMGDREPVRLTLVRADTAGGRPTEVTVLPGEFNTNLDPHGWRRPGGVGYVELFGTGDPAHIARYATTAQNAIVGIDQQPTCDWVIDLRRNLGGSYGPMVAGVGTILGEGPFVGWVAADRTMTTVENRDGRIFDDGRDIAGQLVEGSLYQLMRPMPPVAVLIGPGTSSAGEVTAIAFIGRPETRFFGERSGLTTANAVYPLFDGARLVLAVAAQSDRTGAVYPAGALPGEPVATDWATFGTDED